MTTELFLTDSYLREFDARVTKLAGREIVLNETAFYPGGGGQPPDKGAIGVGPVRASVVDVRREAKPQNVSLHIGRRPVLAVGNSDGDLAMLRYCRTGSGPPGRRPGACACCRRSPARRARRCAGP